MPMTPTPRLYTWHFRAALDVGPEVPIVPVRTSIGKPKWLAPERANAIPSIRELAPYGLFHIEDDAEFERRYLARLDKVGPSALEARFSDLLRTYRGRSLALCCFEKDHKDCHRSIFARWWEARTGEQVTEYEAAWKPIESPTLAEPAQPDLFDAAR